MKKILLSFCFMFITISVFATDVSGNQSGVWNLTGSPYNIIGEVTIPINETLQIEAGVEVIAMGNYKITALGNILAIGTLNDTIRFYGNNELNWGGLRLEDEITTSQFNYCRISNTDDTNDYGIQSINSPVTINHSYLDDHQKGISFSALSSNNPSYMEIKNSKIAYIQKSGITIVDNSNVLIDSCEVTRCAIGGSPYGAIQLSLQNNSHSCSPTITNNYIHHNDMQGITLANLYGYDNMAPTVEYNEVSYNYTGIYLYVGKGYYKGNHIHHNFVENNADSGAGVMLYGNGADAVFTYNEINNNYTGFYLANGATANLGDLSNGIPDDNGYNQIYDNEFFTGEIFSVYNASAIDMKAENNYWGSDDPAVIDITIIDGNDDPAYGIVDYEPYLSHFFHPPQNLEVAEIGLMTWDEPEPGSSSTFLHYNVYLDGVLLGNTTGYDWLLTDLETGQEYVSEVSAVYEDGESETDWVQFTYPGFTYDPPQDVDYELFPDHIHLFWEEPSPYVDFYRIYLDEVLLIEFSGLSYDIYGVVNGSMYEVMIVAIYIDGGASDPVELSILFVEGDEIMILETKLLGNYPNPFNPTTTISFSLTTEYTQNTEIVIYNLKGQKIRQYSISNDQSSIVWNGTDESNKPVSSGVYFYKLVSDCKNIASQKMLLLK